MNLNAWILADRLGQLIPLKMYGSPTDELVLGMPELFHDSQKRLSADHAYLATVDHLPRRMVIEKNSVLICIGDSPALAYYKENSTLLLIQKKIDFFQVFQLIQNIYESCTTAETRLVDIYLQKPDIQSVLTCVYPMLHRPVFVLNAAYQYVASVSPASSRAASVLAQAGDTLSSQDFMEYLENHQVQLTKHGPFLVEAGKEGSFLCVNLFDTSGDYIGCLYISLADRPLVKGEERIAAKLASVIEHLSETIPSMSSGLGTLKKSLQSLIAEHPLSQNQKFLLQSLNHQTSYLAVAIHSRTTSSLLPGQYLCSVLEGQFPGSLFMELETGLLGLVPAACFSNTLHPGQELRARFKPLSDRMNLSVGVSNDFTDLYMIRTYHQEAEAAIENGQLYRPGDPITLFSEVALSEMIFNSLGDFPIEAYMPGGFRKLLLHDKEGEVSYLETLSVFLEENMSYSKAAHRLFIHRSTLIERIGRIEEKLGLDLEDPDQRLQMQIILRALTIEKEIRTR